MMYLWMILIAALSTAIAYISLNTELALRIPVFSRGRRENMTDEIVVGKRPALAGAVLLGLLSGLCMWRILTGTGELLNVLKMTLALLCVVGSGCMDLREKRIPNLFPLTLAVGGVLFLALGFITGQNGIQAYVVSSVMATAGCAVAMLVIMLLTHGGVGAGDIKLLCALALAGGVQIVCGTVAFGVTACALTAVVLLIAKKKNLQSSLPFAPFMLIGFMVSVFLNIY